MRVWLITGATAGFGRAIADAALAAGDTVVAAVRRPEALADLAAEHPDRVSVVSLDVTDAERVPAVVDEVIAAHGRIDVLVNNAGRGHLGAAEQTPDEHLRALMDLHFFGPAALTRAVLPGMRERGSGAIVQLTSQGGRLSFPGVGAYSASKFALEGWSEALAGEVAPHGVKVLIVEPGAFRTSFNGTSALLVAEAGEPYAELVDGLRESMTAADGRQPGDPARAAAAILTALDSPRTPLRLPLGSDAADAVRASLDQAAADLTEWEATTRGTDYPPGE